ncbi:MAG TPA: T9SS type A sorting domain-containing protein [Candidatus Kapabacteria bacterium]|nr:T9SS type A sorting domain-containing protein [Candidatus Kapabacteria bacterium]
MANIFRSGAFILLIFCSISSFAQVNVEMVFKPHEVMMPADSILRICANINCTFYRSDTCGIRTGATVGLDPYETDWPPIVAFDTRLTQGPEIGIPDDSIGQGYIDMRPLPTNAPYFQDYEILDALRDPNNDTLVVAWDSLPVEIDSIHIEDIQPDTTLDGRFIRKYIDHNSSFPDSIVWRNPQLIVIQNFRVRIFYNKSVANISGVSEPIGAPNAAQLQIFPNPASDHVQFSAPGSSISQVVLSDMLGRDLREIKGNDLHAMSLTGLSNGIYMLSAYSKSGVHKTQIAVVR